LQKRARDVVEKAKREREGGEEEGPSCRQ